ncbi:MAG: class I SAM-dependent methyltransferase [Candidatus Jidaibacter sp.]|jgi:16S rRNA (guanine527-N7)-methyltransferase|nr:class I SAM-dependent methyltransferase [Candidatus Jidaibacter sp.]
MDKFIERLKIEDVNVSRETFEKLNIYLELINKWNKSINLVSRKIHENDLFAHVRESIVLAEILGNTGAFIDLGSGNGLPGIVLGIMGLSGTLVERNSKKSVFLKEATRILKINTKVIGSDIRDCYSILKEGNPKFIVSKAVSSAPEVIDLCYPLINNTTDVFLLKTSAAEKELVMLKEKYIFESVIIENKNLDDNVILKVRHIKLK